MAYIVERKIKGNVYLYETVSYWDKEKKQPRQRSKYLGPKEKVAVKKIKRALSQLVAKNYGSIFLLEKIAESIGLYEILKQCYPGIYKEILLNSFYVILDEAKNYLLHHFQEEYHFVDVKTMYSSDVSKLHYFLGTNEQSRHEFLKNWVKKINPQHGIYYDITSFSSYSTKNEFVEWGYNRDKENLPQINLGMVCCQKTGLPFFYNIFPGSIVDVKTIKNFLKYLKIFDLHDLMLVLDTCALHEVRGKGFFSASNISELLGADGNLSLIIPLPFTLNLTKELIMNNKDINNSENIFQYNEEMLFHKSVPTTVGEHNFLAHIYFNEKAEVDQRHLFYSKLLSHESKIKEMKIEDEKAFEAYVNREIPNNYKKYFRFDVSNKTVVRNEEKIKEYLSKLGFFVIISSKENLTKEEVLSFYRDKDRIEKIFDNTKNELDTKRLHSHSKTATDGRLFVKFIATIIYQYITKIMKDKDLFKKYSVTELLKEVSKIKMISVPEIDNFTTECSKTQNEIFSKFDIKFPT